MATIKEAPSNAALAAWNEFISIIGFKYNEVIAWDEQTLREELDALRVTGSKKGGVINCWTYYQGGVETFGPIYPPPYPQFNEVKLLQNRETEILLMARECLSNLRSLRKAETSTMKLTMFTAAQMWGSGKSWLGYYFLATLKDSVAVCDALRLEFGKELVDQLLATEYVRVDLRYFPKRQALHEWIMFAILSSLLSLPGTPPHTLDEWRRQPVKRWNIQSIVSAFMDARKTRFFFHFDEVHTVLTVYPQVAEIGVAAIERFFAFWLLIQPILRVGCFAYCSGRSSFLWALGTQKYYSNNFYTRDQRVTCLLLDTLKVKHIIAYLTIKEERKEISFATPKDIVGSALIIYKRTNGVPRLVSLANVFLAEQLKDIKIHASLVRDLMGDRFRGWLRVYGASEVNPMLGLAPNLHKLYIDLVRATSLRIPLDLERFVNPTRWGLAPTDCNVPELELVQLLNLYIEKGSAGASMHEALCGYEGVESEGPEKSEISNGLHSMDEWYMSFPEVVLDEISAYVPDPRLPLWASFYKTVSVQGWGKGEPLDGVRKNEIFLKLAEQLYVDDSPSFDKVLPFYEGSFFASEKVVLNKTQPFHKFVQFTTRVKAYKELSKEEKVIKEMALLDYLSGKRLSHIKCNPKDWQEEYLRSRIVPGVIYQPSPPSASGDIFYFGKSNRSTHFKVKGDQIIDEEMVGKEAENLLFTITTASVTFVMAGYRVHDTLLSRKDGTKVGASNSLAIMFSHPASFNGFQIPPLLDVIILLPDAPNGDKNSSPQTG